MSGKRTRTLTLAEDLASELETYERLAVLGSPERSRQVAEFLLFRVTPDIRALAAAGNSWAQNMVAALEPFIRDSTAD